MIIVQDLLLIWFFFPFFHISGSEITISKKSPETRDVFKLLKSKSNDWDDFARELEVEDKVRGDLRINMALSSENKLEQVLNNWIDSECSAVTWEKILEVLESLETRRLAREVKNYLKQPKTVEKYSAMEDYED